MRHVTSRHLISALFAVILSATAAVAGTASSTVGCVSSGTVSDTNNDYADPVTEFTTNGVNPDLIVSGLSFDYLNGDQEAWCYWTVPDDYDASSASEPQLQLSGWSRDCQLCIPGLTCATNRNVEFEVSARALPSGFTVHQGYGAIDSANFSYSSTACGSPCATNCFPPDESQSAVIDVTDDASNFYPGEYVIIRLLRDNDVSSNLASLFFVPSFLSVTYPTP